MSAKTSPARRAAFLRRWRDRQPDDGGGAGQGVAVVGAAAAVRRSRVHAACRGDRGGEGGAARGERGEPPSGWGFLDGEELVVQGTGGSGGGKRIQIARARPRQWTPRIEDRFLATVAATCNVKASPARRSG